MPNRRDISGDVRRFGQFGGEGASPIGTDRECACDTDRCIFRTPLATTGPIGKEENSYVTEAEGDGVKYSAVTGLIRNGNVRDVAEGAERDVKCGVADGEYKYSAVANHSPRYGEAREQDGCEKLAYLAENWAPECEHRKGHMDKRTWVRMRSFMRDLRELDFPANDGGDLNRRTQRRYTIYASPMGWAGEICLC